MIQICDFHAGMEVAHISCQKSTKFVQFFTSHFTRYSFLCLWVSVNLIGLVVELIQLWLERLLLWTNEMIYSVKGFNLEVAKYSTSSKVITDNNLFTKVYQLSKTPENSQRKNKENPKYLLPTKFLRRSFVPGITTRWPHDIKDDHPINYFSTVKNILFLLSTIASANTLGER